jgi:hypothetical protein
MFQVGVGEYIKTHNARYKFNEAKTRIIINQIII